jgi:mutator protein MutT
MTFVGAIIQNDAQEFLLQQRDERAPTYPLCWTLFGGKVEPGETPKRAILRELEEELELTSDSVVKIRQIQKNIQDNGVIQIIFHVQTKASLADLTLKEGKQVLFVGRDKLFGRNFAFNIKDVFEKFV